MVILARDLMKHNIGLAVQSPVLGTSSGNEKTKGDSGQSNSTTAPKKVESKVSSTGTEKLPSKEDESEVSSTTDSNNPQFEVDVGKEVGEGHVIEIQEEPDVPEHIKLATMEVEESVQNESTEKKTQSATMIIDKSVKDESL